MIEREVAPFIRRRLVNLHKKFPKAQTLAVRSNMGETCIDIDDLSFFYARNSNYPNQFQVTGYGDCSGRFIQAHRLMPLQQAIDEVSDFLYEIGYENNFPDIVLEVEL